MIIHPIKKKIDSGEVELSAIIEWEENGTGKKSNQWFAPPQRLWYRLDQKYVDKLSERHDAFLGSLLVMAMFFNEDVHVHGQVSAQLLYNLREYQRTLHFWRPQWFSMVAITCETIIDNKHAALPVGSMCSYSGGIDSSYTLWTHLPKNEPIKDFQVTHALHIPGFDTDGEAVATQLAKVASYTKGLAQEEVELLVVRSNTKAFHQVDYGAEKCYYIWGSNVAGTALLFDNLVNRFYFSADNQHDDPIALTINHTLLPLLSNGTVEVVLDGGTVSKYEKIQAISQWENSYDKLMVCYKSPKGLNNCGSCVKCVRLTAVFETLGVLDLYTTFPAVTSPEKMRRSIYPREFIYCMYKPRNFFFRKGKYYYAFNYQCAIILSWINVGYQSLRTSIFLLITTPTKIIFKLSATLKERSPYYDRTVKLIKSL